MSNAVIAASASDGGSVKFLPRFGALLLDFVMLIVAVQILVTALHHVSNGKIQGAVGLVFANCEQARDLPDLQPTPPARFNFALRCQRSLLGLDMSNWIALGAVTSRGDGTFDSESQLFALGPSGEQVFDPLLVGDGWIFFLLFPYLFLSDWLFGATAGKWMLGLRAVDAGNPRRSGLPFKKAVTRNLAMHAGFAASTVLLLVYQLVSDDIEGSITVARALYVVAFGWIVWNCGRLLFGRDALYDVMAGTTVVRAGE